MSKTEKDQKKQAKQTKKLQMVWGFMTGYRLTYVSAVIAVAISTAAAYVVPLVVRFTIDSVLGQQPIDLPPFVVRWITSATSLDYLATHLWVPALVIFVITAVAGTFQFFQKKWAAVASERTAQNMRESLYDHLQHLSYDYHVNAETGDLIQRSTSDVETVRRFLSVQLVEVGRGVMLLGTAYPILFGLHVPLALMSLPVVVVIFAFSSIFFREVQKAFKKVDEAEGRLSTVLQEHLTGVRVVRAFARQRYEDDKFEEKNHEYRGLTWRLIKLFSVYWGVSDFLAMGHMCMIVAAGTWYAVQGGLSIGDMVVFLTVEGMLLWPIRQLGRVLADMGKASVALGRIDEVLRHPTEYPATDGQQPEIKGKVEFKDVHFRYNEEREILKGISFIAEPGMTVALLGPTGSGKSSMVHLLARLYDCTEGTITVDGVDLNDIDKKWIRSHIGFVLQEPFLFAKTVKENIGLSLSHSGDHEVFDAARDAAIHHDIESFDKGYETLVGERGVTLSGGQKQRVAIARALITGNPILVFDDSLSAVDTETDIAIRRALIKRSKNATTFIISHRVTTLSSADLILVLDDGEIVQAGSHDELMAQDGLYKRVWAIQNSLEDDLQKELSIERV